MFYDSKHFLNYFRLTPDGRMLWGGRNDLSTDLDLHESASRLRAQLIHTFPQLEVAPLTHTWTGKLGITFDLMPHIGRVDGVHYALGYGGHGSPSRPTWAVKVGKLLAGQISFSTAPARKPGEIRLCARYKLNSSTHTFKTFIDE